MKTSVRFLFVISTLVAAALTGTALARVFSKTLGTLIFG